MSGSRETAPLRFTVIGEGLLLTEVCRGLATRGHEVVCAFTTGTQPLDLPGVRPDRTHRAPEGPELRLLRQPCDVLLSINNPVVLSVGLVAHPRIAAVNYHDSPLPAYAGLRATAWAIYHGETRHGVTWHRMTEQLDAGDVLVQRRFDLGARETTESLNRRCTEAATHSFPELLTKLETGDLEALPPANVVRSYFGRQDRLPRCGIIDWSVQAEQIERAVRSAAWGPVENDFGTVRLLLAADHVVSVLAAEIGDATDSRPGTILEVGPCRVVVAALGSRLELSLSEDLPVWVTEGTGLTSAGAEAGAGVGAAAIGGIGPGAGAAAVVGTGTGAVVSRSDPVGATVPWTVREIVRRSERSPRAIAIRGPGGEIDYGTLDERSDRMAAGLRARGVKPGDLIAVALRSDADVVLSLVAIHKAGAAFLVLEEVAAERLRAMLATAKPVGVVADDVTAQRFVGEVVPSWRFHDLVATPSRTPPSPVAANSLAYVVFTSGSAGAPSGVAVEHVALRWFLQASATRFPVRPEDRVFQLCALSFDAAIEEIFSALTAGATLCLRPRAGTLTMERLLEHHEREGITITGVFASRLGDLVQAMEERGGFPVSVRRITTGGEEVNPALVRRWREWFEQRSAQRPELINVYGLTETTIGSLYHRLEDLPGDAVRSYFDVVLPGVRLSIRDAGGSEVADRTAGELWIGGPGVARGYLASEAKFGADRFVVEEGESWFRTGDEFRLDEAGRWTFLGRLDRQLKILGYRIEPQEVEAACLDTLSVADCAVVPLPPNAPKTLACVVLDPAARRLELLPSNTSAGFRRRLEPRLPPQMRPTLFYRIPAWPRSGAGKLDRDALEALVARVEARAESAAGWSLSPLENVRALVQPHLHVDLSGREDVSLFELGLDSLGLVELVTAIDALTGSRVRLDGFLRDPTYRNLEVAIQAAAKHTVGGGAERGGRGSRARLHDPLDDRAVVSIESVGPIGTEPPLIWVGGGPNRPLPLSIGDVPLHHLHISLTALRMRAADVGTLAAQCAESLERAGIAGPYRIGGYSFAAVVAQALAVELVNRGQQVPLVFLVEPWSWVGEGRLLLLWRRLVAEGLRGLPIGVANRLVRAPGKLWRWAKRRRAAGTAIRSVELEGARADVDLRAYLRRIEEAALWRHRPVRFDGSITIACSRDRRSPRWDALAREIQIVDVGPCSHQEIYHPPHLWDWLAELERELLATSSTAASGR